MKRRCLSEKDKEYSHYGGRGITVCDEWIDNYENFENWALQNGYSDELTIERKDVNGNYCPENCCWISFQDQQNNTTRSRKITYNGQTKTLSQWSRELGISKTTLRSRIDELGYSFEEAINKSKRIGKANVLIKFQDKEYTQTEFACLCGCTKYWIYAMRKNGYTADEMYEKTKKFRLESEEN